MADIPSAAQEGSLGRGTGRRRGSSQSQNQELLRSEANMQSLERRPGDSHRSKGLSRQGLLTIGIYAR